MTVEKSHSHVKIAFEVEVDCGDGSELIELETLWAVPTSEGFQLDNIPFYAYSVACGDIVSAEPEDDGMLFFTGLVQTSGNSCVRLRFEDVNKVQAVRDALRSMGCDSELDGTSLVAVNVPAEVVYASIRAYLNQLESSAVLDYEEACLASNHK